MARFYTTRQILLRGDKTIVVPQGIYTAATVNPPSSGTRDRRLHPFPADDPFNMPIGVDAVYAPTTDPATAWLIQGGGEFNVNNGWSHPVYISTAADPVHTHSMNTASSSVDGANVRSYRANENGQLSLTEYLSSSAVEAYPSNNPGYWDGHLHIYYQNEIVEFWGWKRLSSTSGNARKIVRNRLDHYAFGYGNVKLENGSWEWRSVDNDPLRNTHGVRAWGGPGTAGLIREHELQGPNPHIPHALTIQIRSCQGITGWRQGNPDSPAYDFPFIFPATANDYGFSTTGQYPDGRFGYSITTTYSAIRMGMKFALDPTICTDDWILSNAPLLADGSKNMVQVAVAKAMRDYGVYVSDDGPSRHSIAAQEYMDNSLANMLKNNGNHYQWLVPHLRRVAGRTSTGSVVQVPLQSHWEFWKANGQGWGGGAPRVPYSLPLAPL